jgi:hypothetical protein
MEQGRAPFENFDRPRTLKTTAEQARALLTVTTAPLLGLPAGSLYTGPRDEEGYRPDAVRGEGRARPKAFH